MTPQQSHYVLQTLLSQGTVRASQVSAAFNARNHEISALRQRLATLEGLESGGLSRPSRHQPSEKPAAARRRRKQSPKLRAMRKLQGKYMGYVRRLKPREKARVRAVREKKGIAAAIRLAASLRKP